MHLGKRVFKGKRIQVSRNAPPAICNIHRLNITHNNT